MHGIELKSGVNDCNFNFEGRCTHPITCRGEGMWLGNPHNWDSKENCTVTQLGIQVCSNYQRELL